MEAREDAGHWQELAMQYKAELRDAEDAHVAFCVQVRRDVENAESAPARIKAALGTYGEDWTGDWLDEACGRLAAKRELTKAQLADVLGEAIGKDWPTDEIVDLVCNVLGVTLRGGGGE